MIIARILGTVVSTQKDERLSGKKLLIVRPINVDGSDTTGYVVAVDTVGAGFHERVLVVAGSSARLAQGMKDVPVDAAIVGVIDTVDVPLEVSRLQLMQLARVIGTVVATVKNDSLEGRKLLIVQTLDRNLEATGKPMVAIDAVGAGVGELVFWCRGKEASFPFKREDTPTDCTIIGIVDSEQHVTRDDSCARSRKYRGHAKEQAL